MNEINNRLFLEAVNTPTEGLVLLGKLTDAASPEAVFGKPIQQGDTTVITANAVTLGLGFGLGGSVQGKNKADQADYHEVDGGGGGGGSTLARPVAIISIRPDNVSIEPIIDVTAICLAFFSAFGAIFLAILKKKKLAK